MTKEEQEIIESTKEFAKAHNIHYDQMTGAMILNAMREQLLLQNVSQQRELLKAYSDFLKSDESKYYSDKFGIEEFLEAFNCT